MAALSSVPFVLTVVAVPPSRLAVAEPRLLPIVETQATWDPLNESVAFFPDRVENLTDPP
jgi:hypothetical protein